MNDYWYRLVGGYFILYNGAQTLWEAASAGELRAWAKDHNIDWADVRRLPLWLARLV